MRPSNACSAKRSAESGRQPGERSNGAAAPQPRRPGFILASAEVLNLLLPVQMRWRWPSVDAVPARQPGRGELSQWRSRVVPTRARTTPAPRRSALCAITHVTTASRAARHGAFATAGAKPSPVSTPRVVARSGSPSHLVRRGGPSLRHNRSPRHLGAAQRRIRIRSMARAVDGRLVRTEPYT